MNKFNIGDKVRVATHDENTLNGQVGFVEEISTSVNVRFPDRNDNNIWFEEEVLELVEANVPKAEAEEPAKTPYHLGHVWKINRTLVAAKTLEEAIAVFKSEYEHEIIENINLMDKGNALINNF